MHRTIEPADRNGRAIQLRSLKYDGSLNYLWPARIVWEDDTGFIWHAPAGGPFTRPQEVVSIPWDWVGRVWYRRWYMVDASLTPVDVAGAPGMIHHYYCNIGSPGAWEDSEYRYVDLDLDVMVYPDGRHVLLDEDEFTAHQVRFGYPESAIASARRAADDVLALAQAGAPPFDGTLVALHTALHTRG